MQELRNQNYRNGVARLDALFNATAISEAAGTITEEQAASIFSDITRDGLLLKINFEVEPGAVADWLMHGVHLHMDHAQVMLKLCALSDGDERPALSVLTYALVDKFEQALLLLEQSIDLAAGKEFEAMEALVVDSAAHWEEYLALQDDTLALVGALNPTSCARAGCQKDR